MRAGTGKMSGNLFEDINWLLPPNYLDNGNENKTENASKIATGVTSPKPPIKEEQPKTNDQSSEKCGWGPGCPVVNPRRKRIKTRCNNRICHPNQSYKGSRPEDQRT